MFRPLKGERAFESIASQIRKEIYSKKLKPGDKLPTERELARIFNASRVSVRSAILNLEQSGLLHIKKGSGGGFFIRGWNPKTVSDSLSTMLQLGRASIADLTEARTIVESQAAGLAAKRATAEDLKKIETAINDFRKRARQKLPPAPGDLNFHVCVAEASKNPVILLVIQSLMDLLFEKIGSYSVSAGGSRQIIKHHQEILEAIKNKEEKKSQTLMLNHVEWMRNLFGKDERKRQKERGRGDGFSTKTAR
jgi:GntR family transcriptional repressor for pyruvate dehydrogenase complex